MPKTTGVEFYVDGALQTTINLTFPAGTGMKMAFSSFNGGPAIQADWVRVVNYRTSGSFTSTTFDAGSSVSWQKVSWSASAPAGTTVRVEISVSNSSETVGTNWLEVTNAAQLSALTGRFVMYRVTLETTDANLTPTFESIDLDFV